MNAGRACAFAMLIASASSIACEPLEYARLKDSTRKDLVDSYCDAQLVAATQREIAEAHAEAFKKFITLGALARAERASADRQQAAANQRTCMRVARDAEDMLRKKFKQHSVNCN